MKQLSKRLTNLEDKMPFTVATDRKITPEDAAAVYHRIMSKARATPDDPLTINGRRINDVHDAAWEYQRIMNAKPKRRVRTADHCGPNR